MHTVHHADGRFDVPGIGSFQHRNEDTFASLDLIGDVSAEALRDALRQMIAHYYDGDADYPEPTARRVNLTDVPIEAFDRDFSPRLPVHLELADDSFAVVVRTEVEVDEDDGLEWLDRLLEPLATRLGVDAGADYDDLWPAFAHVRVLPPIEGQTVSDLLAHAAPFKALAEASRGQGISPATAADLVRGGRAEVLIGQSESDWLEAKGEPPATRTHDDKLDFAKYVAAFANTDEGGLVLYGAQTISSATGDVIDQIRPFPCELMSPRQLLAVVRDRVHPYPMGLRVEIAEVSRGRCLGIVEVPAQPETRKPFLLRGARTDGRVRNTFIGLPTRAEADLLWDDVAGIHSLLVAGRVALTQRHDER